jgi:hypothetical protein
MEKQMKTEKRKGMRLNVFRWTLGDCTNGGISSTHNNVLLVGPGIPEIFEEDEDTPVVNLVNNSRGQGAPYNPEIHHWHDEDVYLVLEPADVPKGTWTMAGGNYAGSSDSRIHEICPYPISIHDRIE